MNQDPLAKRGERILQKMRQRHRGPRIVVQCPDTDIKGRSWARVQAVCQMRMGEFDNLPPHRRAQERNRVD